MQVSVETTQGLERRMTVQVPSERVDREVESRLRSLRGRVRLDGFRPGKVPLKVIQQRYGAQVRGEVLGEVVQSSYGEALDEQSLRPAGAPQIDSVRADAGEDLEYTATFEVLPAVEVKGVEEIGIERPAVEIAGADIDGVLERLRQQQAEYREVARAAADGDRVTIDFEGTVDGEAFEGNRGEDVPVVIGSGQMPAEFEAELVGVEAGTEKAVEYAFPERFPDDQVAGKTARFQVTAKNVEEPVLPALDDTFAERLGISEGGLENVRERIRESLERERDQNVHARLKQQAMEALLRRNEIDLPKVLVDGEIDQLREQAKQRMQQYGNQDDEPELPSAVFEEDARRRVALGLLVNEIVRANEIRVDQQRVQRRLGEIAAGYDRPQEVIQAYTQNRQLMESLEVQVIEDQVVDWIAERAKVTDKPMSFDELVGRAGGDGPEAGPDDV